MTQSIFTYFKVAPRDFGPFLMDTQDLSINRGGSLTLLAMPSLLRAHLEAEFPDVEFDVIQQAASELFFRACTRAGGLALAIEPEKLNDVPAGFKNRTRFGNAVNEILPGLKEAGISDAALRDAARNLLLNAGAETLDEILVERVAAEILRRAGQAVQQGQRPLEDKQADAITRHIRDYLASERDNWPFDLFQFGVAVHRPSDAGQDKPGPVIAALETDLARQQMAALNCPIPPRPSLAGTSAEQAVCHYTRRFGADAKSRVKKRPTSKSAERRFEIGRREKRNFYARILEEAAAAAGEDCDEIARGQAALEGLHDFAGDFEELVADPPKQLSASVRAGMTVLWMDGNAFGKRRSGAEDFDAYRAFSDRLDQLKARLLARIICWVAAENALQLATADGVVARFETLLWGGDEFGFVCPAWVGWEFARLVVAETGGWTDHKGKPLTFSIGLAFAPHDAPISQVRTAADAMADGAKGDRSATRLNVMAFEGVDRVHLNASSYWNSLFGDAAELAGQVLGAADLDTMAQAKTALDRSIGRSTLHRFVFEGMRRLEAADRGQTREASDTGDRPATEACADAAVARKQARLADIEAWILTEIDRVGRSTDLTDALPEIEAAAPPAPGQRFARAGHGALFGALCRLSVFYDYIHGLTGDRAAHAGSGAS
ncbi:hypothetical protein LNKW23_45650 [Paralimibaculum aggregatum]|uniref:Uncharacterized protein n=1 Tax=Paralimibaculum aggregatum TaxID=3036245 RepID=A0ABQ6LTC4_9RHOB|nr:hypothetical protein [Limibaculum sp. NKW23]GMG85345.1 hypothetical protein LNKW23_45650 [Limibaculum sp. NKW23]